MLYKRDLVDILKHHLSSDYHLIIIGARQTGKTSLLLFLEQELKKTQRVYYISLEDPDFLALLSAHPDNLFDIIGHDQEQAIVLIDEIQYLNDPSHFLKYHFDFNRKKIKLIVTGSSAFYLDQKFKDSLAGRKRIFFLTPLNLNEILLFKGIKIPDLLIDEQNFIKYPLLYRKEMHSLIKEILVYGSYPAVVLENNKEEKKDILFDLVDSYTRKDILEYGIRGRESYYKFLKLLASQNGNLINKSELSSTLGLTRYTIDNFIVVGLKSFHFTTLMPFYKNIRKELTKMPKIYFYDCGLRNALLKNFEHLELREDKGNLFECFVFNFLGNLFSYEQLNFWRTKDKNEVDFIIEDKKIAIEVKYNSQQIRKKRYLDFQKRYNFELYYFVFEHTYQKNHEIYQNLIVF